VTKQSLFSGNECFAALLRNKMLALCQPLVAARHSGRAERDPESRQTDRDSRLRGNDGAVVAACVLSARALGDSQ